MKKIFIGIVAIIVIVLIINFYDKPELFTVVKGINGPLTTYDDYSTFNFEHEFNNVNESNETIKDKKLIKINKKNKNRFIVTDNKIIKREVLPKNYSENMSYYNYNKSYKIKREAPQGFNYYFDNI